MLPSSSLTTAEILAAFTEEITARRGHVTDTFDDGRLLFVRSVVPVADEVRPGDRVQGGVALKATEGEVWVYPYVFRQVCRNGAIVAETIASRLIEDLDLQEPETARDAVREGVAACCEPEVFSNNVRKMRTACEIQVDIALALMPMLSRFASGGNLGVVSQIMNQFLRDGDQSRFGLANAITAIARETRDPGLRWDLEELGGGIAVGAALRRPTDEGLADLMDSRGAALVV